MEAVFFYRHVNRYDAFVNRTQQPIHFCLVFLFFVFVFITIIQGEMVWFDPCNLGYLLPGVVTEYHRSAQVVTIQSAASLTNKVTCALKLRPLLYIYFSDLAVFWFRNRICCQLAVVFGYERWQHCNIF